jgi:hypothetical protein
MPKSDKEVTLSHAARRLGCSHTSAWSALVRGDLVGHQDPETSRWLVTHDSVERLAAARAAKLAGRLAALTGKRRQVA